MDLKFKPILIGIFVWLALIGLSAAVYYGDVSRTCPQVRP